MTRHYKQINETGEVVLLLTYDFTPNITDPLIVEITAEEYDAHYAEIFPVVEPEPTDEISNREFVEMLEAVL